MRCQKLCLMFSYNFRFSLDIAKITKRRAPTPVAGSGDDSPAPKKSRLGTSPVSAGKSSELPKRGRGRPQKKSNVGSEPVVVGSEDEQTKEVDKTESTSKISPPKKAGPRVLLSPSDKQRADKKLFGNKKDDQEKEVEMDVSDTSKEEQDVQKAPEKSSESPTKTELSSQKAKESPRKVEPSPKKDDESTQKTTSDDATVPPATPKQTSISAETEDTDLPDLDKKSKKNEKKGSPKKVVESEAKSLVKNSENPSDILARKLSKDAESTDGEKLEAESTALKDFVSFNCFRHGWHR